MKKIHFLGLLITASLVVSCESITYEQISVVTTNPTYTVNIEPVIKANCTGCHASGNQYPDLDTYANVKDATQNGNLICRIDDPSVCSGRIMPTSGRMQQTTIDMIKLWSTNGYTN